MRRLGSFVIGIGLLAIAAAIWYFSHEMSLLNKRKTETAEVILDQMRAVTKLVTAEGYFSEIYDYKDYYQWDIIPLRKKALMRVKAKVIMGYDLESVDFNIDSESKTISVTNSVLPEVIAIDHSIDYYDLSEGTFNRFSEADMDMLNDNAKKFIADVAMKSNLVDLAEERKNEVLETLEAIARAAGYSFEVREVKGGVRG